MNLKNRPLKLITSLWIFLSVITFGTVKTLLGKNLRNQNHWLAQQESPSPWLNGNERTDPSRLLDLFSRIDTDHDGFISFDEWNDSRASFNQLDDNGDGKISRGEYLGIDSQNR